MLDHVVDDLLGDVEQARQVGLDDGVPVGARHLAEHAVARDAGVVDEHVDRAVLGAHLGERGDGRIPAADVAHRAVEGISERRLLAEPLGVVAARPATGDHREAVVMETLAERSADAAHSSRDVGDLLPVRHRAPAFIARRTVQPPCHRRCTGSRFPSWRCACPSRAAASPGCGNPRRRSGGRWRSRRRSR